MIILLLIRMIAKMRPVNNPKSNDAERSFKVITDAARSFGALLIIKSKSINTPYYT